MASHKKLTLGSINNKFISDIPEKRAKIEASIAFRNNALESSKRTNYQNEYDRLSGLKDINPSLVREKTMSIKANKIAKVEEIKSIKNKIDKLKVMTAQDRDKYRTLLKNVNTPEPKNIVAERIPVLEKRMKELQTKAKMSIKGNEKHSIYKTNF